MTRRRLLRRSLELSLVLAGSGGLTSQAASQERVSQGRVSQAEAQYQDRPRNGLSCAACALFRPPGACVVVAGTVSPNGAGFSICRIDLGTGIDPINGRHANNRFDR